MKTAPARIAIVDDAEVQRRILSALLGKGHEVTAFASGEAFLPQSGDFDLVLLDIDMPGLNGYEVCRRLRQIDGGEDLPVVFVSGNDTAQERVAAYEAGGDDFVTKPIAANEVLHKVDTILADRRELARLAEESKAAQRLADEAAASVGELGAVLDFMRRCALTTSPAALADLVIKAMGLLGLQGAVELRLGAERLERASAGAAGLQASVMESLRAMGTEFVFGSRGVVNFERASLLVTNLPTRDAKRSERLRERLRLLGEVADARLATLLANAQVDRLQDDARATLAMLRTVLAEAAGRNVAARRKGQQLTMELLERLGRMFEAIDVSDAQRDQLQRTIEDGMDGLAQVGDEALVADKEFSRVLASLEKLSRREGA